MVGDSTMAELFDDLAVAVDELMGVRSSMKPIFGRTSGYHNRCHSWREGSLVICFASAARKDPYGQRPPGSRRLNRTGDGGLEPHACRQQPHFEEFFLADAMECLTEWTPSSKEPAIFVTNVGLHHNEERSLRSQADGLVRWWSRTTTSTSALRDRPCLLWLQTLPQHFPTPDGTYQRKWLFDEQCGTVAQTSHPDQVRRGDGLGCKRIQTLGGSRQRFNDVTDSIVKAAGIPTIHSWAVAAPDWDEHPGCTCVPYHWTALNATSASARGVPSSSPSSDWRGNQYVGSNATMETRACGWRGMDYVKRRVLDCSHYRRRPRPSDSDGGIDVAGRGHNMSIVSTLSHSYASVLIVMLAGLQQQCKL